MQKIAGFKSFFLCVLLSTIQVFGIADNDARRVELDSLKNRLRYQSGEIKLRDGVASIALTESFKYIDPAGTETLLTGIWGNPASGSKLLGAIVPSDFDPFSTSAWCVIIDFLEDGYVSDSDAEKTDYTKLLAEMKKETLSANEARQQNGYPTMELVGWAETPRYDKETHKFYWAKEIKFGDSLGENTLNYNIRILGRKGILVLNVVSGMRDLPQVQKATPEILSMVNFTQGNTYADYNPSTDKLASYGLAALVAGGIASKTGILKALIAGVVAFKKFFLIGIVAVVSFVQKLFSKRKSVSGDSVPSANPQPLQNEKSMD
jgi:uncharacterized membrane-anchored protein